MNWGWGGVNVQSIAETPHIHAHSSLSPPQPLSRDLKYPINLPVMWVPVRPVILRPAHASGRLVATGRGPAPRASDPAGLGWGGLRICVSNQKPGDADVAGPRALESWPILNA